MQNCRHTTLGDPTGAEQDRESELFNLISRTPPATPAEAAAMLRAWVLIIRGDDGSKWAGALDLLAMERVADFLESMVEAPARRAPSMAELRMRDLDLRLHRVEDRLEGLKDEVRREVAAGRKKAA